MPAMTPNEIDAFLSTDVLCRLACVDESGHPYIEADEMRSSVGGWAKRYKHSDW